MKVKSITKKYFSKKTVVGKTMLSSMLLIIYFFVFFITAVSIMQNKLKNEVYLTHSQNFKVMTSSVENMKSELDMCAFRLSENEILADIVKDSRETTFLWNIVLLKKRLNEIYSEHRPIKNIYMFFPDREIILDNGNVLDARLEFMKYDIPKTGVKKTTYDEFTEFMMQPHKYEIYKCNENSLTYFHTADFGNRSVAICFEIDLKFIEKILTGNENKGKIVLYNHLNEVLYTNNNDEDINYSEEKDMFFESKPAPLSKLVYYMPKTDFYKEAILLNEKIYLLILIYIVSAYLISVSITRKIHKPLKAIVENISEESLENKDINNEYEIIHRQVDKLKKEKEKFIDLIGKKNKKEFEFMLGKVILNLEKNSSVSNLFSTYQIDFKYNKYILGIVSLINEEVSIHEDSEDIFLIINNYFEGFSDVNYHNIDIKIDESTMLMLIGTNMSVEEEIKTSLENIITKEQRFTEKQFQFNFQISFSEIFTSIEDIRIAYKQAMVKYHFCFDNSISFYDKNDEKIFVDYTVIKQAENSLIEALSNGDMIKSKQIITSLFNQCYQSNSFEYLIYANSRILSTFSALAQKLSDERLKGYIDLLSKVRISAKSQELFFNLVEYFCNSLEINEQENDRLIGEIITYINEHFADRDLNVNLLGYVFNRVPSYISYLFKNSTGRMLGKFITETRIRHAEILLCSDEKVDNIASLCGFSSSDSFRRTFKKYTGMIPSEYRKKMKEK